MTNSYFQIAESMQWLSNPLTDSQLLRLGQLCGLNAGTRVLDLGCGKGELLNQWARVYNIQGTGVDESDIAIQAAMLRANELEVWSQVQFVVSEVLAYPQDFHQYHIVSQLNGFAGSPLPMLTLMRSALRDKQGGLLIVGESYWRQPPTNAVCDALGVYPESLFELGALSDEFFEAGVELVDMILVAPEQWDAYYTAQWRTVSAWLRDNPAHEEAPSIRQALQTSRRTYLRTEREAIGWGIFVLEVTGDNHATPLSNEKPLWLD